MHLINQTIRPEWIDYNGHLYDGYYAVIFARAVDAFLPAIGLTEERRTQTLHTVYTMETHVRFLLEVKLGAEVSVSCQILELDAKRVRIFLTMRDTARDVTVATSEQLLMSIDQTGEPHSATWLPDSEEILTRLAQEHILLPMPVGAGRSIAIKR